MGKSTTGSTVHTASSSAVLGRALREPRSHGLYVGLDVHKDTVAVAVNGEPASYDPTSGRWHYESSFSAPGEDVVVHAFDAGGDAIAGLAVTVRAGGSFTPVGGALETSRWSPHMPSRSARSPKRA